MSGVPQATNFSVVRGDAASWTLSVSFPQGSPSNDLNTFEIVLTAKNSFSDLDANAVFQLSKANGRISVDSQNVAIAHLQLLSTDTAAVPCLPPQNTTALVYDVQIVGADAKPYTVARGTITVYADATLLDT